MKIMQMLALSAVVAAAGAAQAAATPAAATATVAAAPAAQPNYTKKTIIKWIKRHVINPSPN